MRIVIAPDSFKECASASAVAEAMARGALRAAPGADVFVIPMADGGEGTVEALVTATSGRVVNSVVTGPLGEPVKAAYGVLGDGETAVIEMAAASGLTLMPREARDPRVTTTRGTGELIRMALDRGLCRIIVGLGGSATNDGGAGMAQALGYSLKDFHLEELRPGGAALADLARIDVSQKHPGLDACEILVACDVVNPLCGPDGASPVYAPQKGATPEMVEELDAALRHFGEVVEEQLGTIILDLPGAGAAGGLGGGLVAFAGARLVPGAELIAEVCGFERALKGADLVLTGEGRLDGQTANGKAPVGIAAVAQRHKVPVVAIAGALGEGYEVLYEHGIDAAFSVCSGPTTLDNAVEGAEELISRTAEAVVRLWRRAGR